MKQAFMYRTEKEFAGLNGVHINLQLKEEFMMCDARTQQLATKTNMGL
jgi:hypothetical protein